MRYRLLATTVLALSVVLAGALCGESVPHRPTWTERRFHAAPRAVRVAWAVVMEQAGLSVDHREVVGRADELVTRWRRFQVEDFGPSVAHDTPTINRDYPYVSPTHLRQGIYRVRARILSRGGGTWLVLQTELLADAYNVLEFEQQQVERYSNGAIEDVLYARVGQALDRTASSRTTNPPW